LFADDDRGKVLRVGPCCPDRPHLPKWVIHLLEYLCTKWNTHSRYFDLPTIVVEHFHHLIGNQIDSARLTTAALMRVSARITSGSVRTAFRAGVDWGWLARTRQTSDGAC
jgi:hypothetical protein